jgi:hypothetical protein
LYQGQEHEEGERNWPRVPCWIQEEVMTDGQSAGLGKGGAVE